ncbi:amino acid/polyamine/organocation transporter, APC superfamily [Coriobacterium glomerans PW2]|uniref:Amino acid/polyamine/organocation transporter, APC superfamily n=1 Tax=Coriobacterium glomerans (strain ATCC 49209 / DSM 20642 / JCM 10262 / PW2) TaxID=700015 RepID=F2NA24_CORGP|nr:APC family permease [Coriobacterium glomerans]AEB06418.1 amino acid/polyamine/organocation transporter, APC superfamily [Coriobacterium glomerans PW2]
MSHGGKFGLASIILLGINAIIGSGIFLLPGQAFALAGTSSLFVFVFITLLAGSLALCFAEAAGLFRSNGAAYIYAKQAFGNFAGFEVGFMKYIVQLIAWAAMAVAFVTALEAVFPAVHAGPVRAAILIGMILALSLVNYLGIDVAKHVNNIATIGKLAPIVIFIGVGIFCIKGGNFQPIVPEGFTVNSFAEAAILIFYAFTGFEAMASASEEMDNPKRNLPIAIATAIGCVSLIYILLQFVCIGILGGALGSTSTPVVDAMATFLGEGGGILVTVGTVISILGINAASSIFVPRGCLALGERGMLPPIVKKMSRRNTPVIAIAISAALVIPLALSGTFTQLAAISVISRFTQYIPTCLSVIVFRRRGMKSTFRLPLGYAIPVAAVVVSGWLLINSDIVKLAAGLGAMVIIAPIYLLIRRYNERHGYEFTDAE